MLCPCTPGIMSDVLGISARARLGSKQAPSPQRGNDGGATRWPMLAVILAYLLLAVFGGHMPTVLLGQGHSSVENVHLPRTGTVQNGDHTADEMEQVRELASSAITGAGAQIAVTSSPSDGGRALTGSSTLPTVAAVIAFILAAAYCRSAPPPLQEPMAVLGVGRWHRTVVLHL